MICYFSGTGNSAHVAHRLGHAQDDKVIAIAKELLRGEGPVSLSLAPGEKLGFVFPVHSWGPPQIVLDFINRLVLDGHLNPYVYAVVTCGANIGNTLAVLRKALGGKDLNLNSGWSIVMPNNYIIIGDVDDRNTTERMLAASEKRVEKIVDLLRKDASELFDVVRGPVPFLLTGAIYPFFNRWGKNANPFTVEETCTSCGLCARVCPTANITLMEGRPVWGNHCTQCLACIHHCPVRAIQYGKKTKNKGRYVHPDHTTLR